LKFSSLPRMGILYLYFFPSTESAVGESSLAYVSVDNDDVMEDVNPESGEIEEIQNKQMIEDLGVIQVEDGFEVIAGRESKEDDSIVMVDEGVMNETVKVLRSKEEQRKQNPFEIVEDDSIVMVDDGVMNETVKILENTEEQRKKETVEIVEDDSIVMVDDGVMKETVKVLENTEEQMKKETVEIVEDDSIVMVDDGVMNETVKVLENTEEQMKKETVKIVVKDNSSIAVLKSGVEELLSEISDVEEDGPTDKVEENKVNEKVTVVKEEKIYHTEVVTKVETIGKFEERRESSETHSYENFNDHFNENSDR